MCLVDFDNYLSYSTTVISPSRAYIQGSNSTYFSNSFVPSSKTRMNEKNKDQYAGDLGKTLGTVGLRRRCNWRSGYQALEVFTVP